MRVTVKTSIARRVSQATFFEIGLSKVVPSNVGVSVLCYSPCVEG